MTKKSRHTPTLKQLMAEGQRLKKRAAAAQDAEPTRQGDEDQTSAVRRQKKFNARLVRGFPVGPDIRLRQQGNRSEVIVTLDRLTVVLRSNQPLFPTEVEQRDRLVDWAEPLEAERRQWLDAWASAAVQRERYRLVETTPLTLLTDFSHAVSAELDQLQQAAAMAQTYRALIAKKPYHEMMPARERPRRIHIYSAPTNSGKTYHACQRLIARLEREPRARVAALLPLRALALQTKDDFMAWGVRCSLVTGEEREMEPGARALAMTTESLDVSEPYDAVFIDECQLAFDAQRGPAYVRAILGARCRELILAVAPEHEQALREMIDRVLGERVEIERLQRLCPLRYEPPVALRQIRRGDLIVAFSAQEVHDLAAHLSRQGHRVGVIYGRMSPAARRAMVRLYRDHGYDVMVATDAIGMGLSTPARRVIFAAGSKFDGHRYRPLKDSEVRQIAGRAGRFGFNEEGFAALLAEADTTGLPAQRLQRLLHTAPAPLRPAEILQVAPDVHAVLAAEGMSLTDALLAWEQAVLAHPGYRLGTTTWEELLDKARLLDHIGAGVGLSREQLTRALFVTYPAVDRDRNWRAVFQDTVEAIKFGRPVDLPKGGGDLKRLESLAIHLTMLAQFQRIAPHIFPPEAAIAEAQATTGEQIALLLEQRYAQGQARGHHKKRQRPNRRQKDRHRQRSSPLRA